MGNSRWAIDIDCKAKLLWTEDNALYLIGSERCDILWAAKMNETDETVNTERYRQRMINLNQALCEKRPEYQKKQHKVILLHDNAPSYIAKLVKETIEAFGWEILSHAAYSPDLAPSDYHLFASMGCTCSAALHFLRRCTKMARWLVWLKRATIFLASTNCQTGGKNV